MRVLLVSGSYPPAKCGVGDYTALLAAQLAAAPELTVGVLTGREAAATSAPAGVELLPQVESWGVGQLQKIMRQVRDWQPDIVHVQYPSKGYGRGKAPLFLPLLLGMTAIHTVQTWHEPLGWLRRLRYLPAAMIRDALIVVEPDYGAFIPGWYLRILQRKNFFRYIPVGSNIPSLSLAGPERLRLRNEFNAAESRLIAYFGFVAPAKGVETIFKIADPSRDRLLLVCDLDPADPYQKSILDLLAGESWRGKGFVTGFKAAEEVACLLAVADIAVFPFLAGATKRNASVLAARNQGTFVLTTSSERQGYDEQENSYYAAPGDLEAMRLALRRYAGQRGQGGETVNWAGIADQHRQLYCQVLKGGQIG